MWVLVPLSWKIRKLWLKNEKQTIFLAFRSDNLGKKCWNTLADFRKTVPPSPPFNVDWGHVISSLANSPNIDWWGVGKGRVKGKAGAFIWIMTWTCQSLTLARVSNEANGGMCSNYFFPRLSERNPKKLIWFWFFSHNSVNLTGIGSKLGMHNQADIFLTFNKENNISIARN